MTHSDYIKIVKGRVKKFSDLRDKYVLVSSPGYDESKVVPFNLFLVDAIETLNKEALIALYLNWFRLQETIRPLVRSYVRELIT